MIDAFLWPYNCCSPPVFQQKRSINWDENCVIYYFYQIRVRSMSPLSATYSQTGIWCFADIWFKRENFTILFHFIGNKFRKLNDDYKNHKNKIVLYLHQGSNGSQQRHHGTPNWVLLGIFFFSPIA